MSQSQGTVLRNGKIVDSPSEVIAAEDPNMAQSNSNDSDTNDSSDISSQLSEIKESYERRINEWHQEFSQLKDLMMAIVNKNNGESQPSSSKGPSKPTQQQGFDRGECGTDNAEVNTDESSSIEQRLCVLPLLLLFSIYRPEIIRSSIKK